MSSGDSNVRVCGHRFDLACRCAVIRCRAGPNSASDNGCGGERGNWRAEPHGISGSGRCRLCLPPGIGASRDQARQTAQRLHVACPTCQRRQAQRACRQAPFLGAACRSKFTADPLGAGRRQKPSSCPQRNQGAEGKGAIACVRHDHTVPGGRCSCCSREEEGATGRVTATMPSVPRLRLLQSASGKVLAAIVSIPPLVVPFASKARLPAVLRGRANAGIGTLSQLAACAPVSNVRACGK